MNERDEIALAEFFESAGAGEAEVPDQLFTAVLADATAYQPKPPSLVKSPERRPWVWGLGAVFGWPSGAVLAACLTLGLGLGLIAPDSVYELGETVGFETESYALDVIWEES